jgi:hypothetical protein
MAHGNIRQSALSQIKAQTVGLLFLLNLKKIFRHYQIDLQHPLVQWLTPETPPEEAVNLLSTDEIERYNTHYIRNKSKLNNINLIKLFYNACLNQLGQEHPLRPALIAAFQAEPDHKV